jgi:hypothetical protein
MIPVLQDTQARQHAAALAANPLLRVSFGQITFDAEGQEAPGQYFSRAIHYPGGTESGVTIGRGYDMGYRTPSQIQRELTLAGLGADDALWLSQAAGLRGVKAENFTKQHLDTAPVLLLEVQQRLFERVTTPEMITDIRRILTKPDVAAMYGAIDWGSLKPPIQELVFDLRYRGDYTPQTRTLLQPYIVANDLAGLRRAMSDQPYWASRGVSKERFQARLSILAAGEQAP